MTLQEKLDAHKKEFVSKVPPEVLTVMKEAAEELDRSGLMARTIKLGDMAPDFELSNTVGDLQIRGRGLKPKLLKGNSVLLRIENKEFNFSVNGFDRNRDLFVRVDDVTDIEDPDTADEVE